ncbi:MAG: acyltransferase [Actinomycetota bacterium]
MAPDGVFVHALALCESAQVGAGTRVWPFAHIMEGAVVGESCNIGEQVFVESGAVVGDRVVLKNGVAVWDRVVLGDDVFIGPYVVFTNDRLPRAAFKKLASDFETSIVEKYASIGANATIRCGVRVGEGAFVGAGAVVVMDVPPYALVVGNPGRPVGWVCACGLRLAASLSCSCERSYVDTGRGLRLRRDDT